MSGRPHILIVNGCKVRQPVFIVGAPHSGTDLLGRALKSSASFHVTIGQRGVRSVIDAFARSPSIARGRDEAAATVLRDAFAQAWQVTADGCQACLPQCREAGGISRAGHPAGRGTRKGNGGREATASCAAGPEIARYGDASPDLMYCAGALVTAFADARIIQVIRDGRDVVAAMLADAEALAWFKPGMARLASEFPQPFLGIETEADMAAWPGLSLAGKCAMRWRGSVRQMARLRGVLDAAQLTTLRYEQVIRQPDAAARAMSDFVGAPVEAAAAAGGRLRWRPGGQPAGFEAGGWRRLLTARQLADVHQIAGSELRRVGYGD